MRAEIEMIAGIIRVFADGDSYGDPYVWVATVKKLGESEVELCGMMESPTLSMLKAIRKECVRRGYKRALVVTYKNDIRSERWIE